MSELTLLPASQRTPAELVELFHRCFEGYFVRFQFDVDSFLGRMRYELVDFTRSRIVRQGKHDIALALLVPRGDALRVAAMGVVANARGQGVGKRLMQEILRESRERQIELEVLTQNDAAIALYEHFGFRKLDRLSGFRIEAAPGEPNAELAEIDLREAALEVSRFGDTDLPWQCSAASLATLAHPYRAWSLGESSVILGDAAAVEQRILSLATRPPARRRGEARRLLQAVFARNPQRRWLVPSHCPSAHAGFFLRLGLREHELSQWRMRCDLSS